MLRTYPFLPPFLAYFSYKSSMYFGGSGLSFIRMCWSPRTETFGTYSYWTSLTPDCLSWCHSCLAPPVLCVFLAQKIATLLDRTIIVKIFISKCRCHQILEDVSLIRWFQHRHRQLLDIFHSFQFRLLQEFQMLLVVDKVVLLAVSHLIWYGYPKKNVWAPNRRKSEGLICFRSHHRITQPALRLSHSCHFLTANFALWIELNVRLKISIFLFCLKFSLLCFLQYERLQFTF